MSDTVIYSRTTCPHCVAAKELLRSKGIEFKEIIVDGINMTKTQMNAELGQTDLRTVPQIVLNGVFIPGGNSGLRAHYGLR